MTHLYAGMHAADRSKLPPSLLGEIRQCECSQCSAPVVCHGPSLDRHRRRWARQGVGLRIVCPTCAESRLAARGGLEVMELTPEVGRHFIRG